MILFDGSAASQECDDENENSDSNEEIRWSWQVSSFDEAKVLRVPTQFRRNSKSNQNSSDNLEDKI